MIICISYQSLQHFLLVHSILMKVVFIKKYPNKLTASSFSIDIALSIAKPTVKLIATKQMYN